VQVDPFVFFTFLLWFVMALGLLLLALVLGQGMYHKVISVELENFRTCYGLFSIYHIFYITSYILWQKNLLNKIK
jgi:hypothetical protein